MLTQYTVTYNFLAFWSSIHWHWPWGKVLINNTQTIKASHSVIELSISASGGILCINDVDHKGMQSLYMEMISSCFNVA